MIRITDALFHPEPSPHVSEEEVKRLANEMVQRFRFNMAQLRLPLEFYDGPRV